MWHSVIDIYSIHISRLYGSLHNKELIQGLIAQTFIIERKDISKWYSPHNNVQETQRLHLEHKLLFTNGKIVSCDTISYLNGFQSRLYTRTFEGTKVHIKEYMLKGYMNPQPAPTHEGSTIENITRYIKDENKEEQLAGRTIVSDWDDNGVKKQTIAKYNHLGHIISYDSWWNGKKIKKEFEYQYDNYSNWVECKEYHDGNYVNLHLCQYKYK